MLRYYIPSKEDMDLATETLDEHCIPYDFDDGNRIISDDEYGDEIATVFDESGIDYKEI